MIKISRYTLLYLWAVGSLSASAAIYYWDPAGNGSTSGGVGTWNTGSSVGADAPTGGADTAWVNGSVAVFGGTVTATTPATGTLEIVINTSTLESSPLQIEGDLTLGFSEGVLTLTDVGGSLPLTSPTTFTIMSYIDSWDGGLPLWQARKH